MWLGVDGGASKTEALLVGNSGVLGFARGGPSNHQGSGLEEAVQEIAAVVHRALDNAGTTMAEVDKVVLGLAGADFPDDVRRLSEGLAPHMGSRPFQIVNDAEIALEAGTDKGWGICAIAGTGGNVFGKNSAGASRQVGGLGYQFGDLGSGIDIASDVLHFAFRSAEMRGPKTALEHMVLDTFGYSGFPDLSWAIYQHEVPQMAFLMLVPLCFQAAAQGDAVAIQILERQGAAIGESIAGCARLLGIEEDSVDVVLAGSLWLGVAPHMRKATQDVVLRDLARAVVRVTDLRPAAGALLMASPRDKRPAIRKLLLQDQRLTGVE